MDIDDISAESIVIFIIELGICDETSVLTRFIHGASISTVKYKAKLSGFKVKNEYTVDISITSRINICDSNSKLCSSLTL